MIYKTLTVATFGLLAWQTIQLSNSREETARVNYQLEVMLQDINHIDEVSAESQTLFKRQMESQEKLEKALMDQSEVLAGLRGGDAKAIDDKKKKAAPPKPQKLTEKEANELVKKLAKIEELQKNKKKAEALKALDEFKKAIWKLAKRTNVGKAKLLSISSSLDLVLKNWKTSDKAYPATIVANKIIAINSPEKVKAKPSAAKTEVKKGKPKEAAKPKKDSKPKEESKAKKDSRPKKDKSKKESVSNLIHTEDSEDQTS